MALRVIRPTKRAGRFIIADLLLLPFLGVSSVMGGPEINFLSIRRMTKKRRKEHAKSKHLVQEGYVSRLFAPTCAFSYVFVSILWKLSPHFELKHSTRIRQYTEQLPASVRNPQARCRILINQKSY